MNKKKILIGILLITSGYVIGIISYRYSFFPINQIKKIYHSNKTTSQLVDLEEQSPDDTINIENFNNQDFTVIFTFGQSNSANYGQTKYVCQEEVYNWQNGQIYRAQDPLKGASGNKSYYRHDGVHFSVIGLEKHAELWIESIKAQQLVE